MHMTGYIQQSHDEHVITYCIHVRHLMTPLLYASQMSHLGIVEVLLSANTEINCQDSQGWTVKNDIISSCRMCFKLISCSHCVMLQEMITFLWLICYLEVELVLRFVLN